MTVRCKICGITDAASLDAAVSGGASFVGFVFFPPSPRAVTPEMAAALTRRVPAEVSTVGLFVDPDDALIARATSAARLDIIQLHGDEPPARAAEIRTRTGRPVMKAVKVAEHADLALADPYRDVADYLMFDARPPKDADRPGGNARAFEWSILTGFIWPKPWFLAGGLTPDNVASAVRITGARHVDTSSGVESSPGRKDPARIRAFLEAAARA